MNSAIQLNYDVVDWIGSRSVSISERELEVLTWISKGYTVKEVAKELYLSTHTIESHKKSLIQKFNSKNTVHLIVQAIRMRILKV